MGESSKLMEATADIVSAFVSNSALPVNDVPALIRSVNAALAGLGPSESAPIDLVEKATPAQIRKSITYEYLISFEDGKPYKTLKRHLAKHGLTITDYRTKWALPTDYPSISPAYSERRSSLAKSLGLGQAGKGGGRKAAAKQASPA